MPWRDDPNPYHVWLSEVILQQTRVTQGSPYYHRFVEKYPTVQTLAAAREEDVLRLWQGLGYYSRARNLHKCAQQIVDEFGGEFPADYNVLLSLRGIGPYTAAAIASICFSRATPVIDGNVFRVISRFFGITNDISVPATRNVFMTILDQLIPATKPGIFNQALMELGALICTPGKPACDRCPLYPECFARQHSQQELFPVKTKKSKVIDRHFHYFVIQQEDQVGVRRRSANDIWKGLYEFGLIEGKDNGQVKMEQLRNEHVQLIDTFGPVIHLLSHRRIIATFYHLHVDRKDHFEKLMNNLGLTPVSTQDIVNLPKSTLIVRFLNQSDLSNC